MISSDPPEPEATWVTADLETTVCQRFRDQVQRNPTKIAVTERAGSLSYAELDEYSDRVATAASCGEPGANPRVALLLPHGAPSVAAFLGVLKAGRVVVGLSPAEPAGRLGAQRELTGPAAVITTADGRDLAIAAGFEPDQIRLDGASATAPAAPPGDPGRLAALITTSGSTGLPKAVMHSHRTMLHNVLRYTNGLGIRPSDRLAWHAPLSGGQGIVTMLAAVLNGATLCAFPMADRGAAGFSAWLRTEEITVLDTLPSVLRHLAATLSARDVATIRLVRIASEPAFRTDHDRFRAVFAPGCRLAHVLASAETGIIAQRVSTADQPPATERLSVGQPAEGIEIDIVDSDRDPVGPGETGELVVSSDYLAAGYWRSADADARFTTVDGLRSFSTGDLATWSADGLVMQGRRDLQVKVRGHRVQVDEVEAALMRLPGIAAAAVAPVVSPAGDPQLVAHLVATPDARLDLRAVRTELAATLPGYAVPVAFNPIGALPLTTTGKVDRQSLAQVQPPAGSPARMPDTGDHTADRVAQIWAQAFYVAPRELDRSTGFLQLGGDSLLAAVVGALVFDEFGVGLDMAYFRTDPSVATMAAHLEGADASGGSVDAADLPPVRIADESARAELSFTQQAMWPSTARPDTATRTNVAVPFLIEGPVDAGVLRRSIATVVLRHDILRTNFVVHDGQPRALVHPAIEIELPFDDLRDEPDPAAAADGILVGDTALAFDLATEPLIRFRLLQIGDDEFRLHRVNHHLIADTWSWRVFLEQLADAYDAELGQAPGRESPPPALQFADYAAWERDTFATDSVHVANEVDWWADRLAGWSANHVTLPFGPPADADGAGGHDGVLHWGLSPASAQRLDALAGQTRATFFVSRLAVFGALLGLATGATELPISTNVTTRRRTELQSMIGPLMNRVILPLEFTPALTFREWLAVVRTTATEASEHAAVPRQRLRIELKKRGVVLPDVGTLFQVRYPLPVLEFGGVRARALARRCVNPAGFELGATRRDESSQCWAAFDARRYDPPAVKSFLGDLESLADLAGRAPDRALAEIWPGPDLKPATRRR